MNNTIRLARLFVLIAAVGSAPLFGESVPIPCMKSVAHPSSSVAINVDEDWFFDLFHTFPYYNEDRNYTLGANVAFTSNRFDSRSRCFGLQRALDSFFGLAPLHQDNAGNIAGIEASSIVVFISAFTPAGARLNVTDAIPDDRPYSSIEGIGTAHFTAVGDFDAGAHALRTEFDVGLLGMPQAHRAQAWFHRHSRPSPTARPYDPKGWAHQISDGGEPTARFTASWKRLDKSSHLLEFSHSLDGSIGYYTNVAASGLARIGVRRTPYYAANTAPLGMANQGAGIAPARGRYDLYWFGGLTERIVAYNALLEGQFRHSDVRVAPANIERAVTEFQTGVAVGLPNFTLNWAILSGRTPEFRGPQARSHLWSGVYVTIGG